MLGSSIAGMLAATVLARHFDEVVIIERDEMPAGPTPRKGVPQAWHVHQLWSSGAEAIETLLPGTMDLLYRSGANRIAVPTQHVTLTAYGWQHRFAESQFMICCSRPLIDWVIWQQVLARPRLGLRCRAEATGLVGSEERVTGVTVRDLTDGTSETLAADLVVDATGRGSQLAGWLAALGLPTVRKDVVDSGITYATRLFQAPPGTVAGFPIVTVYGDHRAAQPGRNGTIFPIEQGRWLVTLSGTRGGEPPAEDEAFLDFARTLRHPLIADLLADVVPLAPVRRTRSTANRRFYFEEQLNWPAGLAVLGDAMAAFNPIFGHGIVAAARAAVTLDRELTRDPLAPDAGARALRATAPIVDEAWSIATTQDIRFPGCRVHTADRRLTQPLDPRAERITEFVGEMAMRHPVVNMALLKATSLLAPPSCMEAPEVVAALRTGATHPRLTEPPLTAAEWAGLNGTVTTQPQKPL